MDYVAEQTDFDSCRERAMAFRNQVREIKRDAAYFSWRFCDRPARRAAFVSWMRDPQGTDVAAASVIPHQFYIADATRIVGVVGDIAVASAHQGRGLAAWVLAEAVSEARRREFHGCFVMPNAEATGPLLRSGFRQVADVQRFIAPVRIRALLKNRMGLAGSVSGQLIDAVIGALQGVRLGRSSSRYEFRESNQPPPDADDLWRKAVPAGMSLSVRDQANLHWRFSAKPGSDYRFFLASLGGWLQAYVVHHLEGSVACIDDFLCADECSARALLAELLTLLRANPNISLLQLRVTAVRQMARLAVRPLWVRRDDTQAVLWAPCRDSGSDTSAPWFVTAADKDV